jgi:hypothetical protein
VRHRRTLDDPEHFQEDQDDQDDHHDAESVGVVHHLYPHFVHLPFFIVPPHFLQAAIVVLR